MARDYDMPCTNPIGVHRKDGSPTKRPCGVCIDCRLDYSRQWAIRCVHEAQMHEQNSFLTLTYNDDNLPYDGSVSREELQKFMKRLRKKVNTDIRFFASAEYGKKYDRPHYHLCLFGYDFPDKKAFSYTNRKSGVPDILYVSKMLGKVWQKGFHTIGEVNFKSAGYVARYCMKKHHGKGQKMVYDGLEPEFALMSRGQKKGGKGGIGKTWFEKYWTDCYPKDFVTVNGKKHRPPKYYDSLLEKKNLKLYQWVMAKRELAAFKAEPVSSLEYMGRDKYRREVTKRLERNL